MARSEPVRTPGAGRSAGGRARPGPALGGPGTPRAPLTLRALRALSVAGLGLALTACNAEDTSPTAVAGADRLVAEARLAGLAPEVSMEVARSVYGSDGGPVCEALRGDAPGALFAWGRTQVTAMPAEQVTDLVEYDRLVVKVYCPGLLDEFDELMNRLNYEPEN
jgi:hypothetical protein